MHARLIFNPSATATDEGVRDALAALLAVDLRLDVVGTTARGHATELAREAVGDGVDAVFVLGGDGTANEALQALAGTDVPLGLLPGGGANVLARALGLPNDPTVAARLQLRALRDGADRRLGLGEANGRLFGFQAGVGFDAAVVRRVEAHPGMKRRLRQGAFVLLGLREWAAGEDRRDPAVRVTDVADLPDGPWLLVAAGNLDPYTYLGPRPLRLTPRASPDRALDLVAVDAVSTGRVLRALGRAFTDGSHDRDPAVRVVEDVDACTITAHRPVPLMVDGDHLGAVQRVVLRHRPALLRVLAPMRGDRT